MRETKSWPALLIYSLHAQLHSSALHINVQHAHLHNLPDGDDRERVAHVAVGKLGDMHQAILLDTDIDEGAKVHHVTHRSLQEHAGLQVFQLENVVAQEGSGQRFARVKSRLLQVLQDVVKGRQANADLFSDTGPGRLLAIALCITATIAATQTVLLFDELAELGDTFGRSGYFALIITPSGQHREHRASSGVTFRVNEGVVERLA